MSITSAPARDNSSRNSDARVQRGIGLGKKRTKKGNDKSKFQSKAEALPRSNPKLNAIIIIECNQPLHMRINDNREKSRFTKLALTHERAILTLRGLQRQIAPVVRKQRANIARITINNQLAASMNTEAAWSRWEPRCRGKDAVKKYPSISNKCMERARAQTR